MIPKNYTDKPTEKLKEKYLAEDSIKKKHVLLNKYLANRVRMFQNMMNDEYVMDYYTDELVVELLQDLEMASEHIKMTYPNIMNK